LKYVRQTAGHTWADYKTNTGITKELTITTVLHKIEEYIRTWVQNRNGSPGNRLQRILKTTDQHAEEIRETVNLLAPEFYI